YEPKDFRQRQSDGHGDWIWSLEGVRRVPYRLPELTEAIALGYLIVIVEGEADADALRSDRIGLNATTCPGGAGKWRDEYSPHFQDASGVIIPDNDEVGRNHAREVAVSLQGIAKSAQVLDLATQWSECPPKGDISDWLRSGGTREQLDTLINNAPDAATWLKECDSKPIAYGHDADPTLGTWGEPDWSLLDDRRGQLPEFPIDALSPGCRGWVERAAHGAGVTTAHVATPLIGISSSLIGTARRVMASRSYTQPMTCWTAIVGFSGTGKTPGIDCTKRALAFVERTRKEKIESMRRAHEARGQTAKAGRDDWKKQIQDIAAESVVSLDKYRAAKVEPIMPREAIDPGPFVAPRLHVTNATIERLAQLLEVQPKGALLLSDELA